MKENLKRRMNSDRAESLTISQILWIVFTVVLVLFVGKLLYDAISKKGKNIATCINNSNTLFDKTGKCATS